MRKLISICSALGLALLIGPGVSSAQLSKEDQKCIDAYDNCCPKIAAKQNKENRSCVKNTGKLKELDPEGCLTRDPKGKVQKQVDKCNVKYDDKCTGAEPIAQGKAECENDNKDGALNLVHDLFGDPLLVAVLTQGKDEAKCQDKALHRGNQVFDTKMKVFRKCKKAGMKLGTIVDEATLEAECMTDPTTHGIPDPDGKIAKKEAKKEVDIDDKCAGMDLAALFPGLDALPPGSACYGSTAALAECVDWRVECRVCQTINSMDGTNRNCDEFDNGVLDGSCSAPIGAHKCVLDPAISTIQISTPVLPLPPFPVSGAIDIDCGAVDPGTGKASCDCSLQVIDPIEITGIGYGCVTPGMPCPSGEIDCDGGNALDVTMASDHNIGACTDNPDCAAQCAASCAPDSVFNSGCEGFCVGGARDNLPCANDSECPDGSCPGQDGLPHGNICGCDCIGIGGAPSPAGGLLCNMPVNIGVEADSPCGDGDVLIAVGTRCLPLTTQTVSTQITDANNSPGKLFPPGPPAVLTGVPGNCEDLATSITTGTRLVGALNFFDSTIGDLVTKEDMVCQ